MCCPTSWGLLLLKLASVFLASHGFCQPNITFAPAPKTNIWKDLSAEEVQDVARWLLAQPELNISTYNKAATSSWVNNIYYIERQKPNKTDALVYIDQDGPEPTKYAHAAVFKGAQENATLTDYIIGPLPINNNTSWRELGNIRWMDPEAGFNLRTWEYNVSASAADVIQELLGGSSLGLPNDTFDMLSFHVGYQDDTPGHIIRWDQFKGRPAGLFDTQTLLSTGLMYKSDVTGRDPSKWELKGWYYNGIYYNSTDELRQAIKSPDFVKTGLVDEGNWTSLEPLPLPGEESESGLYSHPSSLMEPPSSVHPGNQTRYTLDGDNMYVAWMGFSFYFSFSFDMGVSLFDIRYDNERIMYELAPQEILVQYAGFDPYTSGHSSHDSHVGVGRYSMRLVPGYDCPSFASFLDMESRAAERATVHRQVVCIFEYNNDSPIQRHTTQSYVTSTSNVYLTLRYVATIGDYDYTVSYLFYPDASFGVEVQASGWIIAAPAAHNEDYGFPIHSALSGGMHEHLINFKADFDVLGTNNSVVKLTSVPTTELYPWANGKPRRTMKLERTTLQNEEESRWDWDGEGTAKGFVVVNEGGLNQIGQPRGYRLVPGVPSGSTISRLSAPFSTSLFNSSHWAEHDLFVTAHHDNESRSTHPMNAHDANHPRVNFNEFINGENLAQTDLVVWFNLALSHWPTTSDLPNTLSTVARSGVRFAPANFFDIDQTRRSRNQVRIEFNDSGVTAVRLFGQEQFMDGQTNLMAQLQNYTSYI